jgi:hypothetical protein
MTRPFWPLLFVLSAALAVPAHAQTPAPGSLPVLELFTSQGCSSCPAADALFKGYAARRDVVALSMPVDYWDYLGWKDTLANAKFTQRQRAYAKLRGDGQIYTPQVVINGRQHVVGSSKADIEKALKSAGGGDAAATQLTATISGDKITIDLPAAGSGAGADMTVWLAVVRPEAQVDVKSGENRGKKLIYFNVVRDILPAGMWSGAATSIKHSLAAVSRSGEDRLAVLVQKGPGGPIVAASWIDAPR